MPGRGSLLWTGVARISVLSLHRRVCDSHLFVTGAAVVAKWSAPVARRLRAARHVRVVCHAHAACSPGQVAAAARARAAGASSFVHPGTALARSSAPRRVSRVGHVSARCVGEFVNHVFIGYIDQTFAHHQHPQPCADQRSLSPLSAQHAHHTDGADGPGRSSRLAAGIKLEKIGDDYDPRADTCLRAFVRLCAESAPSV